MTGDAQDNNEGVAPPPRRRTVYASRVVEFKGATDPALLRAAADWLDTNDNLLVYGINLTLAYEGDGIEHILHLMADGPAEVLEPPHSPHDRTADR